MENVIYRRLEQYHCFSLNNSFIHLLFRYTIFTFLKHTIQWISFILLFFFFIFLFLFLLQLSQFPPTLFSPSIWQPPLLQAIPTPLLMSMGHAYKFIGYSISYTVLYIPWLFCKYLFVLNPLISSPIPLLLPPIWQPSKRSLYP